LRQVEAAEAKAATTCAATREATAADAAVIAPSIAWNYGAFSLHV